MKNEIYYVCDFTGEKIIDLEKGTVLFKIDEAAGKVLSAKITVDREVSDSESYYNEYSLNEVVKGEHNDFLLSLLHDYEINLSKREQSDFIARLFVPFFENARFYFESAEKDGLINNSESPRERYSTKACEAIFAKYK